MKQTATIQDNLSAVIEPATVSYFDYEAIQFPTKALIHQSARFLYIKQGRGTFVIGGVEYEIKPNMLIAITPWKITEITAVEHTIQLMLLVYDYQYLNYVLKGIPGSEKDSSELLQFLYMEPVLYLDSVQAEHIDNLMEQLKIELGVRSTSPAHKERPLSQLYVTNKIIELMIMYRRYIMAERGEKDYAEDIATESSILSYIYGHSSEQLTLAKVAGAFYMSESTLSRRISEITGTSFSKLVSIIRIEKASDYLIYTSLTLDEIAVLVGFVDAPHLSKNFVEKVGVTPMKYRNIYGKSQTKFNRSGKEMAFAVMDYVHKNCALETLNAEQVASRFGVSPSAMNKLMLYYCDMNFETLLNYLRINRACEILATTDQYVIDVAFEVGYNNIKTFNTNFAKFKGMSPTVFRNNVSLQKAGKDTSSIPKTPLPEATDEK